MISETDLQYLKRCVELAEQALEKRGRAVWFNPRVGTG